MKIGRQPDASYLRWLNDYEPAKEVYKLNRTGEAGQVIFLVFDGSAPSFIPLTRTDCGELRAQQSLEQVPSDILKSSTAGR